MVSRCEGQWYHRHICTNMGRNMRRGHFTPTYLRVHSAISACIPIVHPRPQNRLIIRKLGTPFLVREKFMALRYTRVYILNCDVHWNREILVAISLILVRAKEFQSIYEKLANSLNSQFIRRSGSTLSKGTTILWCMGYRMGRYRISCSDARKSRLRSSSFEHFLGGGPLDPSPLKPGEVTPRDPLRYGSGRDCTFWGC